MFEIEQTYDLKALAVLCRAARKVTRRAWRFFRVFVWIAFVLGALLLVTELASGSAERVDVKLAAAVVVLIVFLLFDDRLNAWVALRQMVPGTAHSVTVFRDEDYTVKTDQTETRWQFGNITALAESERYYILFLGKRHGQLFDKQGFRRGESDAFRAWLEQKTGKTFQKIK